MNIYYRKVPDTVIADLSSMLVVSVTDSVSDFFPSFYLFFLLAS